MRTNFIYDIHIQVEDILITSKDIDVEVQIQDTEKDGRICNVSIYNLKEETVSLIKSSVGKMKVSVLYNTEQILEDYFNGSIIIANDYRDGDDMVLYCRLHDGIIDAINTPVSVSAESGATKLQVIRNMVNGGAVSLGQYPASLNESHGSRGSQFVYGDLHSEVQKFLGRRYVVAYKDGQLNIYERVKSLINSNIISSDLLYDYPRRQVTLESIGKGRLKKGEVRQKGLKKEYSIKVLPRPSFARGTQVKVVGSKYIDEKYYTISTVNFTLNKSQIYCDMTLIEGALNDGGENNG